MDKHCSVTEFRKTIRSLEGEVALVTGSGQGIGKGIAVALAQEGAHVIIADRFFDKAIKVSEEIIERRGYSSPIKVDVTSKDTVDKMVKNAINKFGKIDILVNNAGILKMEKVETMKEKEWDQVIDTDLKGVFICSQAVAKEMKRRRKGKIINVSSNAGIVPRIRLAAYCAAKAGVIQFSRVLALELAPYNINVNILCPGSTETEMTKDLFNKDKLIYGDLKDFRLGIPLRKIASVEDHASMTVFLCSEKSNHITGQIFVVDGGQTMG